MPIQCSTCLKVFSSHRYFKCHFNYQKNSQCRVAYYGSFVGQETPKKRPHEESNSPTSDNECPDDNGAGRNSTRSGTGASLSHAPTVVGQKGHETTGAPNLAQNTQGETSNAQENGSNIDQHSDEDQDSGIVGNDDTDETETGNHIEEGPDDAILEEFTRYVEDSSFHTCNLTPEEVAGIQLLDILIKQRAPLRIYDAIYKWHCNNTHVTTYKTKKTLLKGLEERYGMEKQRPKVITKMVLPHSKSVIDLVYHDFDQQLKSLLTDPRIEDDDYLFFDNDPFSPPPCEFTTISDINTGLSYRESYDQLVTDPGKQVLLPIIMHMDAAVTGQFDSLPIEALKFTLGIFKATTRDKVYAWRNLGYVTKFLKEDTRADDILQQSGGMDADHYLSDNESERPGLVNRTRGGEESGEEHEEDMEEEPLIACAAQDLHAMLDALLESYRKYQKGITWNLRYGGKHQLVEFIPFVMFIKGDTQEHDKHCGSYTSRTQHVAQLCRYCCCPTNETASTTTTYPRKSQPMVQALVQARDLAGLKALSQQCIDNAWYKVRFGLHNDYGIHGACPLEVLHWLQLGKYGYVREMLFAQLGKDSALANEFNALARTLGKLFKRQSDRDLPRLDFSKGVKKGKLMAHEMSGLMVVLAACLRCYKGRHMLLNEARGRQKDNFDTLAKIKDWLMLLETLLQWEAWMKEPEMSVTDVNLAKVKIRELMDMEKAVGKRDKNMGFNLFKFHASVHACDDMLYFGVPSNVNTQSDESHHKISKTAAIHTQRRVKTFNQQTARNLHEVDIVDIAMEEICNGRVPWDYLEDFVVEEDDICETESRNADEAEESALETRNTGTKLKFFYSEEKAGYTYTILSRMNDKAKFRLTKDLEAFIGDLMDELGEEVRHLMLFTEHKRNELIFRGTPRLLGKAWRDWVMIDWGEDGILPAQIHMFVDLQDLPDDCAWEAGTYAIVESAKKNLSNQEKNLDSELFVPCIKEHKGMGKDGKTLRQFWMVNVESIHSPAVLIPDVGNPNKASFLQLIPRSEWSASFVTWLHEG